MDAVPLLSLKGISKAFGAVVALEGVDFEISRPEVVALVGDNGAGKSTLIKIISGVLHADSGQIRVEGLPVRYTGPESPKLLGIETVYQDLALVNTFDTIQNIYLGREITGLGGIFLDHKRMHQEAKKHLTTLDINLPSIRKKVRYLSGGQRQAVAISRATGWGAKLIIMDEPTAALGVKESRQVLKVVKTLRASNVSVILVSHNIEHVFAITDRITVLRHGRVVASRQTHATSPEEIVRLITGASLAQ
ncbi:MAG: sugar ABC transporter ATP-binding protein [Verrucomicrobia bacterium]|nr:sugar ABC transporter ATP-binding protein [Verrucomicrobiota bacterium]